MSRDSARRYVAESFELPRDRALVPRVWLGVKNDDSLLLVYACLRVVVFPLATQVQAIARAYFVLAARFHTRPSENTPR